jgi:hypothetical protein
MWPFKKKVEYPVVTEKQQAIVEIEKLLFYFNYADREEILSAVVRYSLPRKHIKYRRFQERY